MESTARSVRISIWLPITSSHHQLAYEKALADLEGRFPKGCSVLRGRRARDGRLEAIVHGVYAGDSGREERDTHAVFSVHIPYSSKDGPEHVQSAADQIAEILEEDVHWYYSTTSQDTHVDAVYQEAIFVEHWGASFIASRDRTHPLRLDDLELAQERDALLSIRQRQDPSR